MYLYMFPVFTRDTVNSPHGFLVFELSGLAPQGPCARRLGNSCSSLARNSSRGRARPRLGYMSQGPAVLEMGVYKDSRVLIEGLPGCTSGVLTIA